MKIFSSKKTIKVDQVVEKNYAYYQHKKHIFIFSVLGRSGSTTFQRMLNSSNQICVFGEPKGLVGDLLNSIRFFSFNYENQKKSRKKSLNLLNKSFETNNHTYFYPNAFNDLEQVIDLLKNTFVEMFKPLNNCSRFGFKDIRIRRVETLVALKAMFPDSFLLFTFRDPLKQWLSNKNFGNLVESDNLDRFLTRYQRISDIFLTYHSKTNNSFLVSNDILYDKAKLISFFKLLDIEYFDENLIGKMIASTAAGNIPENEKEKILQSEAYSNYIAMKEIYNEFLKTI